jgi:hypothetical protein
MATKSNKPVRLIVTLADIHSGSTRSVLPPKFSTTNQNEIGLNSIQEYLWECWERTQDYIKEVAANDPYVLVLNGDLVEGIHHGTKEVWSPDTRDHVRCAIKLLKPVAAKAKATFVIRGTECHTGTQENTVAEVLGAVANPEAGDNEDGSPKDYGFDRLTLDMNGVRHVFRHHIGTSVRRTLAATQLSVNLAEEQLEAINNGEQIPQVICCAHRHKYGEYKDDNGLVVVSPPWQALTRFGHKVVSQARTKPGVHILDHRGRAFGELPEVRKKLFDTPAPYAATF